MLPNSPLVGTMPRTDADQRAVIVYRPASIPKPGWLPAFGERVQVATASAYHWPRIVRCASAFDWPKTTANETANRRRKERDVNL